MENILIKLITLGFLLLGLSACAIPWPLVSADSLTMVDDTHYLAKPIPVSRRTLAAQTEPAATIGLLVVLDKLRLGKADTAKSDLQTIVKQQPANAKAVDLLQQLTLAPERYLQAFPRRLNYPLVLGDSWESLAQKVFNDPLKFVILARLNEKELAIPLVPGDTILLPAMAEADNACQKQSAVTTSSQALSTEALHQRALALYKREEFTAAIRDWDQVLEQDPNHLQAAYYRSKAYEMQRLQERLGAAAKTEPSGLTAD